MTPVRWVLYFFLCTCGRICIASFTKIEAMNTNLILLLGYLPFMLLIVILMLHIRRTRSAESRSDCYTQGYSFTPKYDAAGTEKTRVLEDEGLSLDEGDEYDLIKERLLELLEREKIYLDPNIRISDVAERLRSSKAYLSKVIKMKLNRNFCQLVHYYRVKEAMRLFVDNPEMSISDLCSKVGFNSMTTFNTAFGRNTGFTPAEWCKDYKRRIMVEEQYVNKERHS